MSGNNKNGMFIGALVALVMLLAGLFAGSYMNGNNGLSDEEMANIASQVKVPAQEPVVINSDNSNLSVKVDALTAKFDSLSEIKEDKAEVVALELAKDELADDDFKEALMAKLNSNDIENQSVEDKDDIKVILVQDSDVDVDGEDGTVSFDIKVKFFNDGDNDEEDLVNAKFTVTFDVSDLDEDDSYDDAEAELDELVLIKVNY